MRRLLLATVAAALLGVAPAHADVGDTCEPLGAAVQSTACHGADVVERDARAVALAGESERAVQEYEDPTSFPRLAHAYQRRLGDSVPLRDAPWFGTHNSFNSVAEMGPALSVMDSNQKLSLVQQLRVDVRSLELDLHWFPSARGGGMAPVVCHAQGGAGCSVEKPLGEVLAPIAAWLRAHPDEIVLLYLENQLGGEEGEDAAAAAVEQHLGDRVFRPAAARGACGELPLDETRDDVRAAGKQVVLVGTCGSAASWRGLVHGWSDHEETRPQGFSCHADFGQDRYDATIVRYFEDDTWLTSAASNAGASERDDGIDAATTAAMLRCGVDLLGFDQLGADDDRHLAGVWSWADGEPTDGDCATMGPSGRWQHGLPCHAKRAFGCVSATGTAYVARKPRAGTRPPAGCGAPRTGYENERVRKVLAGRTAWLALPR